jgi:hypothetical protein
MAGSGPSSFIAGRLGEIPTAETVKEEHTIALVDHTKPAETPPRHEADESDAERGSSEATAGAATPSTETPLIRRLTNTSLSLQQSVKQEITKRKYARFRRDRYEDGSEDTTQASAQQQPAERELARAPTEGEAATPAQSSHLERGRAKAKSLIKRKTGLGRGKDKGDRAIDILYENQRGWFLFGVPRYSAASLLPCDPRPWQNADFRTSPVDIRNAQVPDPGWEWEWKNWYVDMSRDVDEEGWEYSAFFRAGFNWHGNHPWFHSWVRRRRWLRMRKRRPAPHKAGEKSHELTAEYFTIHPTSIGRGSEEWAMKRAHQDDEHDLEKMDMTNIGSLVTALRKATVDREKLVAVRTFVETANGDELHYLPARIPEVMGLFLFQSSRRQLLADLIAHHDDTTHGKQRRKSYAGRLSPEDATTPRSPHGDPAARAQYLHDAVQAAEDSVRELEYWSDIKGMAQGGEMPHASAERLWQTGAGSHPQASFASKQKAEEGAKELSRSTATDQSDTASSKKAQSFFDAPTSPPSQRTKASSEVLGKSPEDRESVYTTAEESGAEDEGGRRSTIGSPAQQGREKVVRLGGLDGALEEEGGDAGQADAQAGAERDESELVPHAGGSGMQIVAPKAEPGDVVEMENNE